MSSIAYIIKNSRIKKKKMTKAPSLQGNPQKKAICIKILKKTPKKPNSAQRAVARVNIVSLNEKISAYIPGIGHNLKEFSLLLICGRGARDLPGVKYRAVRGVFDLDSVKNRKTRRSLYGVTSGRKPRARLFLLKKN